MKHPDWLPKKEKLLSMRLVRPFARHLDHPELWHLERHAVARGAMVGVFFGLMIPVAQFLFSALAAIFVRGNLAVAAVATLVSNPLTYAPIYWFAYRLGQWMLSDGTAEATAVTDAVAGALALSAERTAQDRGWLEGVWYWLSSAGGPLLLGLVTMAVISAAVAYAVVHVGWVTAAWLRQRAWVRLRQRASRRRAAKRPAAVFPGKNPVRGPATETADRPMDRRATPTAQPPAPSVAAAARGRAGVLASATASAAALAAAATAAATTASPAPPPRPNPSAPVTRPGQPPAVDAQPPAGSDATQPGPDHQDDARPPAPSMVRR